MLKPHSNFFQEDSNLVVETNAMHYGILLQYIEPSQGGFLQLNRSFGEDIFIDQNVRSMTLRARNFREPKKM